MHVPYEVMNGLSFRFSNELLTLASFQLWNIGRIRHLLNAKTAETLVHAYITSRLDCGNALLYGLPEALLRQLLQNTAARIVTRAGRAGTQQRPARAAALAACQFPGGLQNPPPDLPCLAWSGASLPLSAADCLQTYQVPSAPIPSYCSASPRAD